MKLQRAHFLWMTVISHVLALLVMVIVFQRTQAQTAFCVIAGILIGCGGAGAVSGRTLATYSAFGSLMSYVFWIGVSAINQGQFLALVPTLLLLIGCGWYFKDDGWPSFLFTLCVAVILFAMAVASYRDPFDVDGWEPDEVQRSAVTSMGVLGVGILFLALSFAEKNLSAPRLTKRKRRRDATN